jgi:glutamine synthetase
VKDGAYRGYLEDRRPNSMGDPYLIAGRILQTIETIPTGDYDAPSLIREAALA